MKSASLEGDVVNHYTGCHNSEETINVIELLAISGHTEGIFEGFGFFHSNQRHIALLMTAIHDYRLEDTITLCDGSTLNIVDSDYRSLGPLMNYYWQNELNDKCIFSKIYNTPRIRQMFDALNAASAGMRVKIFEDRFLTSNINIFRDR